MRLRGEKWGWRILVVCWVILVIINATRWVLLFTGRYP